jgi:N-methylhydantoinase B
MGLFTIGGINPRTARYYSYVETYGGGQGAVLNQDGMDGVHTNMTNTRNTPVEVIEIAYPLRVHKYSLVQDTDGAGKFRGGLGLTRELEVLDHAPVMSLGTDRLKLHPWGLKGGKAGGTVGSRIITPAGEEIPLPSKTTREVAPGSRIILQTAGAGGYGDPYSRDPQRVRQDVIEGFISIERAKDAYGVVLNAKTYEVDAAATRAKRKQKARTDLHE